MLISDKLIFVELQKTGSTGLKKFLGNIVGGESTGKTAVFADELTAMGKPVVGLVCHPLNWYLDQWRQGCEGKGDLYKHLVEEKRWDLLRSRRTNRPAKIKEGGKADPKAIPDNWGAEHAKTYWYGDVNNVEAFHEWLHAVSAARGIRNLIGRGYQVSPVSNLAGLMTYHYVIRFVRNGENLERSVDTLDALRDACAKDAITTHYVRAEHAGEDLIKVLDTLGVETSPEQQTQAQEFKRKGTDTKLIRKYYDEASLRLVAEREALMLELFDYEIAVSAAPASDKKGKKNKADKPPKPEKAAKAEKAGKGEKAASAEDKPKLSKEERAQKREARAERRAVKEAKAGGSAAGAGPAATGDAAPEAAPRAARAKAKRGPAAAAAAPASDQPKADKPTKVKRVKNRPVDDDVVETEA